MGQPQSTEGEGRGQDGEGDVPYTMYSKLKPGKEPPSKTVSSIKGITVVNPRPVADLRANRPMELQKLDKVHRFWPILKSSLETVTPSERPAGGLDYKDILAMSLRYQEHLSECSNIVGMEQKALASRLKDLEMFTAGVAQQMIRRQERMSRVIAYLKKVTEVTTTLTKIQAQLDHCVPLALRLNSLLPENQRLEPFKLNPHLPSEPEPIDVQQEEGQGPESLLQPWQLAEEEEGSSLSEGEEEEGGSSLSEGEEEEGGDHEDDEIRTSITLPAD